MKGKRALIHRFVVIAVRSKLAGFVPRTMASLPAEGSPPMSIRHGVRVVSDARYSVEQVLLALGEQIGHGNITYGSRMSKAVVAFVREERLVHVLVEKGLVLDDQYIAVSPLFVPSTRVTVSGVPPFIPNELLEKELTRFGKFASGFRTVRLGCKDARLQHVQSLRRQAFMYLHNQSQTLEVSFKVKFENGFYTVYASDGVMKCFECGDVGHKRSSCPHREQVAGSSGVQRPEGEAGSGTSHTVRPAAGDTAAGELRPAAGNTAAGEPRPAEQENEGNERDNHGVHGSDVNETEAQPGCSHNGQEETAEGGQDSVTAESCSRNVEDDEDEMCDDDSMSQVSETVSQDDPQSYTLQEINDFLDESYGRQEVEITDFFPNVDKFIRSVMNIRRVVGYEQLSKQKRFRLKKLLTKLRKEKREKISLKV